MARAERRISPYPWHELPSVSEAQLRALRRVRRRYEGLRVELFAEHLRRLSRADVQVRALSPAFVDGAQLVSFERAQPLFFRAGADRLVALVDAELLLALVSSLVSSWTTSPVLPPVHAQLARVPLDPLLLGAAAGLGEWLLRQLGVSDAEAVRENLATLPAVHERTVARIDLDVQLGATRGLVRLFPLLSGRPAPAVRPTPRGQLRRAGAMPLRASVLVAADWVTLAELLPLLPGDVVFFDGVRPNAASSMRLLTLDSVDCGWVMHDLGDGRLRFEGRSLALAPEAPIADNRGRANSMAIGQQSVPDQELTEQLPTFDSFADALLHAPVLLRAEVGSVTVSAAEWAELGAGDVLALDQPATAKVTLVAGGRTLACGELVEVDGRLGVRITERSI